MPFDLIRLALDESVRSYDQDGRLHVKVSHLTKACVNGYHGNEIPGWEKLGLDPYRVYQLLRDPAELQKAVPTFNNIPLLDQHIPVTAADAKRERVIGSTGSEAAWNDPYIDNSLVFWTDPAIILIERNEQRELSSAYRYKPVMTPGVFQGAPYDGVMTEIQANHVALVEDGRVGSDVVVMDSKPKEMRMKTALSPRAAYTAGSMAAYLAPKLAKDQKLPDLQALLAGVTAKNWDKKKPEVAAAIVRATKGIFAQDAEVHIHEHLDGAGAEAPGDDLVADPANPDPQAPTDNGVANTPVTDDDLAAKVQQILQQAGVDENDIAIVVHALKAVKQPDPDDANGGGGEGGGNGNGNGAASDTEQLDKPGLAKGPAMDSNKPVTARAMKVAMDAAVEDAITKTTERLNARDDARRFVRPWVGDIAVAMDSATEILQFALEQMGEDVKDVHPSAFKALLSKIPKPNEQQPLLRQPIAMDATGNKAYLERFPNANRLIKH